MSDHDPFPTIRKLAQEIGATWDGYDLAVAGTAAAEQSLRNALTTETGPQRRLNPDASFVLFGSFARYEMLAESDYDWALLIDGVVDNDHAALAREIRAAMSAKELKSPGTSGTFGDLVFSHDLVHRIGGGADSNANLTRRMLMLLESRPFSLSPADSSTAVWNNVLGNILERYFEQDVHFAAVGERRVPRFLLNDLTRYWRTIGVDYAAKYREQEGKNWAVRNAKLRFSRKLLYASGLAFCLSCELEPPANGRHDLFGPCPGNDAGPFIERARLFSATPSLEYVAAFVEAFVVDEEKRRRIAEWVFASYNTWLLLMGDASRRVALAGLSHEDAGTDGDFSTIRQVGSKFARGLELLFFNRDRDTERDPLARLALEYVGF